jgi:hypothetical protein
MRRFHGVRCGTVVPAGSAAPQSRGAFPAGCLARRAPATRGARGVKALSEAVVGREQELAAIDRFLEALPDGGRAIVLEGEPGIGKAHSGPGRLAPRHRRDGAGRHRGRPTRRRPLPGVTAGRAEGHDQPRRDPPRRQPGRPLGPRSGGHPLRPRPAGSRRQRAGPPGSGRTPPGHDRRRLPDARRHRVAAGARAARPRRHGRAGAVRRHREARRPLLPFSNLGRRR